MEHYPVITVRTERARNILRGHPWIFSGALAAAPPLQSGSLCEVQSGGEFLGIGYYNPGTDIAVRMLTRNREAIDQAFFEKRFQAARSLKEAWVGETNAYRVVFGESDQLPGLVVDRYDQTLVVQFHTAGMHRLQPLIVPALLNVFSPRSIWQRSASHGERVEGAAPDAAQLLHGAPGEEVVIVENGLKFLVNVARGQKTGFFLDQRENRACMPRYCAGRNVLNAFSYTGAFSVYAARTARAVASVDISAPAIECARRNFEINGLDPAGHAFVVQDVFDYLNEAEPGAFETIILDPPSFARRRDQVPQAIKAYTTINSKALQKLPPGGVLATSSCTTHIDELTFIKILHQSAVLACCRLRVLHSALQPFDHAYDLHFPEGRYLKFFVLLKDS